MTDSSRDVLRTALFYGAASVFWFVVCDYWLPIIVENPARLALAQQMSGYLWIAISVIFVFICRSRLLRFMNVDLNGGRQREDLDRLRLAAAVFDSTHEGVLITDSQGQIVHVNRAFMDITGYGLDDVLGANPSRFKSGRHRPEFYRQMYRSILSRAMERRNLEPPQKWHRLFITAAPQTHAGAEAENRPGLRRGPAS